MLEEAIKGLAGKHNAQKDLVSTEEGTKNALVMPFLSALGYDVFNPLEVNPEFTADVGTKKGEKVDYAIMENGRPSILVECKPCNTELNNNHASQLFRYFSATDARFSILTNGIEYRFFADLDRENRMDERPFLTFNIHDFDDQALNELARFSKEKFNVEAILNTASGLKNLNLLRAYLKEQFDAPDEDFVRFVGKQVFQGKMTQQVLSMFQGLTKRAIEQVIRDKMRQRFKHVLDDDSNDQDEVVEKPAEPTDIETTEEEILGHRIIQAIVAEKTDPSRVYLRDAKSYCAILFDDNNRKPIVRLHFNTANKKITLFGSEGEEVLPISEVSDLYQFKARLHSTVEGYLN